jgi:CBS-domain-containing membrane protein
MWEKKNWRDMMQMRISSEHLLMQVKEIMTKDVVVAHPNQSVGEVADLLMDHRFHAVPVVDENQKVEGIIAEADFFTKDTSDIYLPLYIAFARHLGLRRLIARQHREVVDALLKATARDIMTPECTCMIPEMEIREVLKVIRDTGFTTFPVVTRENRLVGIVTTHDIVRVLCDLDLKV